MKVQIGKASKKDVPAIVAILANDKLGNLREEYQKPLPKKYFDAFKHIDTGPNQALVVIENELH